MDVEGPRRGTRDNGLRCASYVVVRDLDPRVADALLSELRDNGIAAYAAPTPAASGGYLELRLPHRPLDRLWVDEEQAERARGIVERETAAHRTDLDTDLDFEKAWQQVLTSLQSTPADDPDASRAGGFGPAGADSPGGGAAIGGAALGGAAIGGSGFGADAGPPAAESLRPSYDPADEDHFEPPPDEDHFEPPPAPPFPKLRPVTFAALASIALGLLIIASNFDGGSLTFLGVLAILGGAGSLIWHMRQGPPNDSGWDDGAVV